MRKGTSHPGHSGAKTRGRYEVEDEDDSSSSDDNSSTPHHPYSAKVKSGPRPSKRPRIQKELSETSVPSNNEVDHLVPPLPPWSLGTGANDGYTPEKAFEMLKRYVEHLMVILTNPELGLSPTRMTAWREHLLQLKSKCAPQTVIAVLGMTGSGKSSMLNALLDESEFLPSSCMGACTAAVVELSYHDKDTIDAVITFFTVEEWAQELRYLRSDLFDGDGNLDDDLSELVEAAKAKFNAIYTDLSLEALGQYSIDELLQHSDVHKVLGTVKKISCSNARDFHDELATFMESQEELDNMTTFSMSTKAEAASQMWPLVKSIKCQLKADVLSTGAILVDLPGDKDTNAARAKIAQDYLQKSDAFFIVAPINRAVNDKVAQELLGRAFKSQLLMDGCYNDEAITFICSKTDHISSREMISTLRTLRRDKAVQSVTTNMKALEVKISQDQQKFDKARTELARLNAEATRLQTEADKSRQIRSSQSVKLSQSQLDQVAASLDARRGEIQDLNCKISQAEFSLKDCNQQRDALCALARNRYTKAKMKKHFMTGLKALENADTVKVDPDSSDSKAFQRDYSQVNLKVFCISADDYSKGKGMQGLRQHIKEITWSRRDEAVQKAIELLKQFVCSIELYLHADGRACSEGGEKLRNIVTRQSTALIEAWAGVSSRKNKKLKKELRRAIKPAMLHGARLAQREAVSALNKFGNETTSYKTYRATMVRDGAFRKDLNEIFVSPLIEQVAYDWKNAFDAGVKALFLDIAEMLMESAERAFKAIEDGSGEELRGQLQAVTRQQRTIAATSFKTIAETATLKIKDIQKDLSRKITPDIQYQLHETYADAARQRGRGCLNRMKNKVLAYVEEHTAEMFAYSTRQTGDRLDQLADKVESILNADLKSLERMMSLNYSGIWEAMKASPGQIKLREAVRQRLEELKRSAARLTSLAKKADSDMRLQQQRARQS
ncbi:hypothetical protein CALVIDRAFT_110717 [Calocera viscosa TUFC12733]|uniref:Dynamin N-terminal domain-containing protein n=1 Tax=Calocera viscosa (strain TUFC12733) TaxID=1330018 RepID=A0A167MHK4_CALVF|nr:hypothetical protein CALVIDRAFT_110717 [Calocera viscosa TUFC12733]